MDKRALRRESGAKKRALTAREIEDRSRILADKLYKTPQYQNARSVYAYLSFNQEVRTRPIIERAWSDGKRVAVPKVIGDEMRFIWIDDFDHLAEEAHGISEPVGDGPQADNPGALVLVPGLAFDLNGHRVGYGGGFYDRFLAREPDHPTVALCYDFQLLSEIKVEDYDMPVQRVITDR